MKAHIEQHDDEDDTRDIVNVEINDDDQCSFVVAQVALPFLHRRLATNDPRLTPVVWNKDLPAWLRGEGGDDKPPVDDGRMPERWLYVLNEMIWAVEALAKGNNRLERHVIEPGEMNLTRSEKHPGSYDINITKPGVVDMEGIRNDAERMREGLRLFMRYIWSVR